MQNKTTTLTADRLREVLNYDPETGFFTWKVSNSHRRRVGDRAGCLKTPDGYRLIRIDGVLHRAHKLVWLYLTGSFPVLGLDHINRVKDDNRAVNLREANQAQQGQNLPMSSKNTSGHRGVHWSNADEKWQAAIRIQGKKKYLGQFDNIEEASAAVDAIKDALEKAAFPAGKLQDEYMGFHGCFLGNSTR